MLLVGRATAAPLSNEQQHLVAAIRKGMECRGPHRASTREQGSNELGKRGRQLGNQRDHDDT